MLERIHFFIWIIQNKRIRLKMRVAFSPWESGRQSGVQSKNGYALGRVYTTVFWGHIARNDTFFREIKNFCLPKICLFCAFIYPNTPI